MKYLELLLGMVGIVVFGGLFLLFFSAIVILWVILWLAGFPIKVTGTNGETLGHMRWLKFYRRGNASS